MAKPLGHRQPARAAARAAALGASAASSSGVEEHEAHGVAATVSTPHPARTIVVAAACCAASPLAAPKTAAIEGLRLNGCSNAAEEAPLEQTELPIPSTAGTAAAGVWTPQPLERGLSKSFSGISASACPPQKQQLPPAPSIAAGGASHPPPDACAVADEGKLFYERKRSEARRTGRRVDAEGAAVREGEEAAEQKDAGGLIFAALGEGPLFRNAGSSLDAAAAGGSVSGSANKNVFSELVKAEAVLQLAAEFPELRCGRAGSMLVNQGGLNAHRHSLLELLRMGAPVPFTLPPVAVSSSASASSSAARIAGVSGIADRDGGEGEPEEKDRNLSLFQELLSRSLGAQTCSDSGKSSGGGAEEEGWRPPRGGPPGGPQSLGANWPDLLIAGKGPWRHCSGRRASLPLRVAAAAAVSEKRSRVSGQHTATPQVGV
ncbi:hypothetical protein cyc_02172 [Cyclospora cayetanensis]|uniref:Uncharacterized protein n=1 Tax=Cyclospora cayetanensis TaxID=88456 RepID=A0A1D3D1Y2_9EIME|nr:hypothetical protein cyc_02172 [Cyclospora cayetanensis]